MTGHAKKFARYTGSRFPISFSLHNKVHREFHDPNRVQFCRLLSVKTGGCPEDCAYCPQSAHYATEVSRGGLLPVAEVAEFAERAAPKAQRVFVWARRGGKCGGRGF